MSEIALFALGLGLGVRHATDPDHVVAVTTLVQRERGIGRILGVAALWGLGHTLTFVVVGLLVLVAGLRMPPTVERLAEGLVALTLVGLGIWHLGREWRPPTGVVTTDRGSGMRSMGVGIIHGLAGSAGMALLFGSTLHGPLQTIGYLLAFGVGTVIGMLALTGAASLPLGWLIGSGGRWRLVTVHASALLAIALGVTMLIASARGG